MMIARVGGLLLLVAFCGCENSSREVESPFVELAEVSEGAEVIFIGRLNSLEVDNNSDAEVFYQAEVTATLEIVACYRGELPSEVSLHHQLRVPAKFWPDDASGIANMPASANWCQDCLQNLFQTGFVSCGDEDMLFLVYAKRNGKSLVPVGGKNNTVNTIFRIERDQRNRI